MTSNENLVECNFEKSDTIKNGESDSVKKDIVEKEQPETEIYQEEDNDNKKKIEIIETIDKEEKDHDAKRKSKKEKKGSRSKTRSRSRSKEDDRKKKKKKKKGKKNQKTYEEKLTDPKIIEFTKRSINLDKNIPQNMKEKFQKIETNLLALCITN